MSSVPLPNSDPLVGKVVVLCCSRGGGSGFLCNQLLSEGMMTLLMPIVPLLAMVSHGTVAAEAETMGGSRVKGEANETGGPQIGSMLNLGLWCRDKAFDQPVFLLEC